MAETSTKTYRTVLNWLTGLTVVVCNLCEARHVAGTGFTHALDCPERQVRRPPRKIKALTRVMHFTIYAEVDEKGGLIIP